MPTTQSRTFIGAALLVSGKVINHYLWFMRSEKYLPHYTVEDYRLWEGDWELIDGLAYAMTPSPGIPHQDILGAINAELRGKVKNVDGGCGNCKVLSDVDWHVNEHTVLRPDLTIVCNETAKFIYQTPILIVEVLSPATALRDRNHKFEIYEEEEVKYYILVEPETKLYNVFVLVNGQYLEQSEITSFTIHGDCEVQLSLTELLASI